MAQAMLMLSHQYLLEEGIPLLVSTIRQSIEAIILSQNVVVDWTKPTQFVTEYDVEQLLYRELPRVVKYGSPTERTNSRKAVSRNWIRFILPDTEWFDPMWDICASPVWEDAQEQILEKLWRTLLRDDDVYGWRRLFDDKDSESAPQKKLVANVVAQLKKSSTLLFPDDKQEEASHGKGQSQTTAILLQRLPTVLELGDVSFQQHHN
jgi:hypothetical protein